MPARHGPNPRLCFPVLSACGIALHACSGVSYENKHSRATLCNRGLSRTAHVCIIGESMLSNPRHREQ